MASRAVLVIAATAAACSHHSPALYPAGTARDDGYGDLAQKSASLLTTTDDAPAFAPRHHHHSRDGEPYGGDPYAGAYADDGEAEITDLPAPHRTTWWSQIHTRNTPRETPVAGFTGAIEGTVTWRGAAPPALATACGTIDQPSVRIAGNGAVAGVLVYIEHVEIGRAIPNYSRPAGVGGLVAKRGCALAPAVQIVTPLPNGFTVHGDTREVTLRITQPTPLATVSANPPLGPAGPPLAQAFSLQPAGRVVLPAQPGVTRIEADDGSLAAAWVVALDTPYYALTDDGGHFRLDELAAGTYDLSFLRPAVPTRRDGKLSYGPPVIVHRSIKIDATHAAHLDVAIGP